MDRQKILTALEDCVKALEVAFDYDGFVFGLHNNDAVDALCNAESILEQVKDKTAPSGLRVVPTCSTCKRMSRRYSCIGMEYLECSRDKDASIREYTTCDFYSQA